MKRRRRLTLLALGLVLFGVAIHDIRAPDCDEWYRFPIRLAAELLSSNRNLSERLEELALRESSERRIHGWALSDSVEFDDPYARPRAIPTGVWTHKIGAPLEVVLLTAPRDYDETADIEELEARNPEAVPIADYPGLSPFVLVLTGGGHEAGHLVLLWGTGEVVVWLYNPRERSHEIVLRTRLPEQETSAIFESLSRELGRGEEIRVARCGVLHGLQHSLLVYDSEHLAAADWSNFTTPPRWARAIFDRLFGLEVLERPDGEPPLTSVEAPRLP